MHTSGTQLHQFTLDPEGTQSWHGPALSSVCVPFCISAHMVSTVRTTDHCHDSSAGLDSPFNCLLHSIPIISTEAFWQLWDGCGCQSPRLEATATVSVFPSTLPSQAHPFSGFLSFLLLTFFPFPTTFNLLHTLQDQDFRSMRWEDLSIKRDRGISDCLSQLMALGVYERRRV